MVEVKLRRSLNAGDADTLAAAFNEGLSVFQSGGHILPNQLLSVSVLAALATPPGAWLWASVLEAIEQPTSNVATLSAAILDICSSAAAMLFVETAVTFTG